jgi:predicted kinase
METRPTIVGLTAISAGAGGYAPPVEAIIFCGIQGSGKSTFYKQRFADTHVRINLDMLRTRRRESILLGACLEAKQRFVVDNTNTTLEARKRYTEPAIEAGFRLLGFYFESPVGDAIARNLGRPPKERVLPGSIVRTHKELEPPEKREGFDQIFVARANGDGSFHVEEMTVPFAARGGEAATDGYQNDAGRG